MTSAIAVKEWKVRHGSRAKQPVALAGERVVQHRAAPHDGDAQHQAGGALDETNPALLAATPGASPAGTTDGLALIARASAGSLSLQATHQPADDVMGPPEPDWFIVEPGLRWFHGRSIRAARILWMTVTAYSPDERSCGDSADGRTATMHCVTTNANLLVAADPTVLAYGSMLSIPGYALEPQGGELAPSVVPVLDCGGAIKGFRLDLLFPTHEAALEWGVQLLPVTVWEYADGMPRPNPRRLR